MIIIQKQYCRDELVLDANDATTNFNPANATIDLLKAKQKITGKTGNNGTKNVEIMISLKKSLKNLWKNL